MTNTAKEPRIGRMITLLALGIVILCVLYFAVVWFFIRDWIKPGQFGDTFGALSALFSGLAFGGVIIALHLQRVEIKHQWKELELTRKEITGQKEQLEAQDYTLRRQNFENSFFQLLNFHNGIVDSLQFKELLSRGV